MLVAVPPCPDALVVLLHPTLLASLQREDVWSHHEIVSAVARSLAGLASAFLAYQIVRRVPWPRPFRAGFLAVHLVAAPVLTVIWGLSTALIELLVTGESFLDRLDRPWDSVLGIGMISYVIVAGVSYADQSSARAARAEALAARTQLSALRAQLHPHFLFNALHTVMQLVPGDPARAAKALELLSDLLRTTLGEERDEVSLREEWRFVSRYVALERIRFGDRLVVRDDIAPPLLDARVPAFALQTLVENAVRHGAAPRRAPTEIVVAAANGDSRLTLSVRNSGAVGAAPRASSASGTGTGLARLRERLAALYGDAARLECRPGADGGFEAVLMMPLRRGAGA
jgi:two-component system LytT family sensor kinase